jgi:hypothetical protein
MIATHEAWSILLKGPIESKFADKNVGAIGKTGTRRQFSAFLGVVPTDDDVVGLQGLLEPLCDNRLRGDFHTVTHGLLHPVLIDQRAVVYDLARRASHLRRRRNGEAVYNE